MTNYYCRGRFRWMFVLMLLVFGGAFVSFYLLPALNPVGGQSVGERLVGAFPLGLLFGGVACAGMVGLLVTFTVIRLDENGIIKRWCTGSAQQCAWRELVQVDSPPGGSIALTDFRGSRLTVPSPELGYASKAGRSLYEALETQLANLPKDLKAQMAELREFRFGVDASVIAAGFLALLCVAIAVTMSFMPTSGPPPPLAYKLGLPAFFLLGALFVVHLGLRQATRVLMLTDTALIDRSLFGTREIPFDQVVSVTTKDVPGKSGTMEWTTVKSATTTIGFPAQLPNYDKLVQAIQARVGTQVAANAPQAIQKEARQSLLQNVIGLFVIGSLFGLGLGGLAVTGLHEGQDALQRQMELDVQGKRTKGQVTGTGTSGSKSRSYNLNYTFEVDGKTYSRSSSVSRDAYEQVPMASAVGVDYLPNDPEVSRITLSIAKDNAKDKIRAARVMIAVGCGLPILFGVIGLTQKPRYRTTK